MSRKARLDVSRRQNDASGRQLSRLLINDPSPICRISSHQADPWFFSLGLYFVNEVTIFRLRFKYLNVKVYPNHLPGKLGTERSNIVQEQVGPVSPRPLFCAIHAGM